MPCAQGHLHRYIVIPFFKLGSAGAWWNFNSKHFVFPIYSLKQISAHLKPPQCLFKQPFLSLLFISGQNVPFSVPRGVQSLLENYFWAFCRLWCGKNSLGGSQMPKINGQGSLYPEISSLEGVGVLLKSRGSPRAENEMVQEIFLWPRREALNISMLWLMHSLLNHKNLLMESLLLPRPSQE